MMGKPLTGWLTKINYFKKESITIFQQSYRAVVLSSNSIRSSERIISQYIQYILNAIV